MTGEDVRRAPAGIPVVIAFGLVACVLYGVGAGLRGDIGILLQPLADQCGLAYQDVSLCIAVMQFVFGATQPVFGMLATRRSNRFVLVMGAALLAASLAGMVLARSFAALMVALGILFGAGAGALAFGLILTSAIHFVGPERAMMVSGMLNASAGLGSFVLSPVLQQLLQVGGVPGALLTMLVPVALLVPIAFVVTSRDPKPARVRAARAGEGGEDSDGECSDVCTSGRADEDEAARPEDCANGRGAAAPTPAAAPAPAAAGKTAGPFALAFRNRTFLLLVAGFSTCGFHMVIIESHLFNEFVLDGIDAQAAAWAFSVYGIATILGALLSGFLSTRVPKGGLLAFYYGFRAVWVLLFLFVMPHSLPFSFLFAIGLGMTGDATVSPTSGLVNEQFSIEHVATLIGFLFLCHQVGAFLSAWLGGILLDATGGYAAVWLLDVGVCIFAAIMSARIRG